ncbi:MAG: bluB 2 [Actinoallomurus sp.]|nr:bluB 2 [Actinoallomurus sp.]
MTPDELLTTTRTVRKRLDLTRPVPPELIGKCLEIALQAPSGSNRQSWQWVVVTDPDGVLHRRDVPPGPATAAGGGPAPGPLVGPEPFTSGPGRRSQALRTWLRAVAVHATAMRGLVATQMAAQPSAGAGDALAACHEAILSTGAALLTRAQREAGTPGDIDIADLLKLANAIAWASEQTPQDPDVLDRLLALVSTSLRPRPTAAGGDG